MNLPLWQYGKSHAGPGKLRGSYTVLAVSPEFTDHHRAILQQISQNAAWRPGGDVPCAPVTACWPLGEDDWLLLRFLDDGVDDHHRARTMRIEAALVKNRRWEEISGLFPPEAWPAPCPDGAITIDLTATSHPGEKPPQPMAPTLYGNAGELMKAPFTPSSKAAPPSPRTIDEPPQMNQSIKKSPWKWIAIVLFLSLLGSIFMTIQKYDEVAVLKNERGELQDKIKGLEKPNTEALLGELSRQCTRLQESIAEIKNQIDSVSSNLSNVERDVDTLKSTLTNAVKDEQRENATSTVMESTE